MFHYERASWTVQVNGGRGGLCSSGKESPGSCQESDTGAPIPFA